MTTQIVARQNLFYIGPVPVFYWPRFIADADDPTPPFRNFEFLYGNYFGASFLTDWNGFKLFGIKPPPASKEFNVENWNVDIDELTMRGPALGSEFGYYGRGLLPYSKGDYKGYLDLWGIIDNGVDVLGPGPAIITNGPPGAGKAGFQRNSSTSLSNGSRPLPLPSVSGRPRSRGGRRRRGFHLSTQRRLCLGSTLS